MYFICNCETWFVLTKDNGVRVDEGEIFAQRAEKGHWWEDGNCDVQRGCLVNSRRWAEELRDAVTSQAETSRGGEKNQAFQHVCEFLLNSRHKQQEVHVYLCYTVHDRKCVQRFVLWCWWLKKVRLSYQSLLRSVRMRTFVPFCTCGHVHPLHICYGSSDMSLWCGIDSFWKQSKQNPMWLTALPGAKRWWDQCFSENSATVYVWEVNRFVARSFGSSCRSLLFVFHYIKKNR